MDIAALEAVELVESPVASPIQPKPTPPPVATPPKKGKGKSKVKAAAARWESPANETPKAARVEINRAPSPGLSSFRSIPASVSERSLNEPATDTLGVEEISLDDQPTPSALRFSDVPLGAPSTPPSKKHAAAASRSKTLSPSSNSVTPPRPVDFSTVLPEPVSTPPVEQPSKEANRSFFGSTLGFGLPSATSSSTAASTEPERSASSNWRSTMSNLISRSTSATSPNPAVSPAAPARVLGTPPRGSSTSFLLSHITSPAASRDRRTSREGGGGERIRAGFQRVRSEMEGAAREIRRERGDEQEEIAEGAIDWAFWGAVVQDYEDVARTKPKELSRAIQQGIPAVIRGAIWQLMSSSKDTALEETFKVLLKLSSPHEKSIVKDLARTFPQVRLFQQEGGGGGQESLFMVVKAYSLFDPDVGYTQGLAFIAAILLLNMPDEEAFCVLVRLMDSYNLRSHFLADMPGLQLRLFQFDRLMEDMLPLLHTHLVRKGVKSSMFASQWFMTLFSYRFPLPLVYRVLDIVFAEGIEAIFRFSLALMRRSEDVILTLEFEGILAYLQTDVFECYRSSSAPTTPAEDADGKHLGSTSTVCLGGNDLSEDGWLPSRFVRDAYESRITPLVLDQYESEYDEQQREHNKHALELDQLRNANRNLSHQVNNLEASLAIMNTEHVDLVRQLVMLKIEKEETENELVRYKMLYAELAHAQQDALCIHSRRSNASLLSQPQD
ncbi:GTPase-activating protein [Cryptotrichosporon argae]